MLDGSGSSVIVKLLLLLTMLLRQADGRLTHLFARDELVEPLIAAAQRHYFTL